MLVVLLLGLALPFAAHAPASTVARVQGVDGSNATSSSRIKATRCFQPSSSRHASMSSRLRQGPMLTKRWSSSRSRRSFAQPAPVRARASSPQTPTTPPRNRQRARASPARPPLSVALPFASSSVEVPPAHPASSASPATNLDQTRLPQYAAGWKPRAVFPDEAILIADAVLGVPKKAGTPSSSTDG